MQCWTDIDTSKSLVVAYDENDIASYWAEETAIFTATAPNTWIQILGNDVPGQMMIDDITMVECN